MANTSQIGKISITQALAVVAIFGRQVIQIRNESFMDLCQNRTEYYDRSLCSSYK